VSDSQEIAAVRHVGDATATKVEKSARILNLGKGSSQMSERIFHVQSIGLHLSLQLIYFWPLLVKDKKRPTKTVLRVA